MSSKQPYMVENKKLHDENKYIKYLKKIKDKKIKFNKSK